MEQHEWLANQFENHRTHLRGVAYRMLGSLSEAEDAVQESWLHLSRSDTSEVENLGGWLTTVVARVCLDMLRSRNSRHEEPLEEQLAEANIAQKDSSDPEQEVLLAESVGLALLVVLDTLNPVERLAFVLHDIFGVSFGEIAPIVGRTPTAARQLASRARRRIQNAGKTPDPDNTRQRKVVNAFLAAARGGNFEGLLTMLAPDVVFRADAFAVQMGATAEVRGSEEVARQFAGRAQVARLALLNGAVGAVWAPGGKPRVTFGFTMDKGKIVEINLSADPEYLSQLDFSLLEDPPTA